MARKAGSTEPDVFAVLLEEFLGSSLGQGKLQARDGGHGPTFPARVRENGGRFLAFVLDRRSPLQQFRLLLERRAKEPVVDGCLVRLTGYTSLKGRTVFVDYVHERGCPCRSTRQA